MADIERLVEATKRKKAASDRSVGWPLAAIKAIQGQGITHKPDVERLKKEILERLRTSVPKKKP